MLSSAIFGTREESLPVSRFAARGQYIENWSADVELAADDLLSNVGRRVLGALADGPGDRPR